MDIEERMTKADTEISMLKDMQSEQRREMAELRGVVERGFSEERAARERGVRWSIGLSLTILALVLGILVRLSNLF